MGGSRTSVRPAPAVAGRPACAGFGFTQHRSSAIRDAGSRGVVRGRYRSPEGFGLCGALIAVDDTDSGFALLLYELLARAGMVRGLDYRVVAFGGTPRRFEGLVDGDFDATMLNAGFDLRAADRGCFVVRTVSDVLPDYIATVLAALPRWLEKESAARPFLRAWDRDSPASNEFPFILSGLRFQSCYWCAVRDRRVAIPVRTVLPLVSA
jgi:hypothetical protein